MTYQGTALAMVAACGPWHARLQDIWDGVSNHGLDAWDLHETIVDVEDERCRGQWPLLLWRRVLLFSASPQCKD
jgi:hypothetical protein